MTTRFVPNETHRAADELHEIIKSVRDGASLHEAEAAIKKAVRAHRGARLLQVMTDAAMAEVRGIATRRMRVQRG